MPRNRFFAHALLAAGLLLAASPAAACLPLPEGYEPPPPPSREDALRTMVRISTDIVSGKALGTLRDGRIRFLVEHVYKGKLRRGAVIAAWQGWGLDPPMCAGLIQPPPIPRGTRGTIYFYEQPELNFIFDEDMVRLFAMGVLDRPRR